jgi:hypothetical protein
MHHVMVGVWINSVMMQVPGDALACQPAFADIVPGNRETAFIHVQQVRLDPFTSSVSC